MIEILLCATLILVTAAVFLFRRGVLVRQSENWDERLEQMRGHSKNRNLIPNTKSALLASFMAKDAPSQNFSPAQLFTEQISRLTKNPDLAKQAPLILSMSAALLAVGVTLSSLAVVDIELKGLQDISFVLMMAIISGYVGGMLVIRALFISWQSKLSGQAPDVIDYLMLAVEAGINIDVALIEVHRILKPIAPAMAHELERLSNDLAILPSREVAFQKLIHRTGVETFIFLKQALLQGEKYGTPIAASLKVVALESRQHALRKRQERARKLPVFISIPLMILILPPIIAVSTGPGFIQLMRTF